MTKRGTNAISWLYKIVKNDLQQPININDTNFKDYTETVKRQLEVNWNLEMEKCPKPSLLKILIKTFGIWPLIAGAIYSSIEMFSQIQIPLYIGTIVSYYASDEKNPILTKEFDKSIEMLVILSLLTTLLYSPVKMYCDSSFMKMKGACSSIVYQKLLNSSDQNMNGLVLRLLTNDMKDVNNFLFEAHHIWKTPFETLIIGYVMYRQIGVPAIFGMIVMLTVIPIQIVITRLINECEMHFELVNYKRITFVKQLLEHIKLIKLYAWERSFGKVVYRLREREINVISRHTYLSSILCSLKIVSRFAAFITFVALILTGGTVLMSSNIFILSLYYQFLCISWTESFPMALTDFLQVISVIDQLQNVLLLYKGKRIDDLIKTRTDDPNAREIGVVLDNVSTSWDEDINHGIHSINLNLQPNCIYGIMGGTGSGKTTLLSSIIGELEPNAGKIEIKGLISYMPQSSLIFDDTIRQNIIFGEEFNENRYKTVCRICQVNDENDENLNDEQISKINLARTIYRTADIYIIDDPFCFAVEQGGLSIFASCLQQFLKGKCVILVTNEVKYLKLVDQTITMENGCIKQIGKFDQELFDNYTYAQLEKRIQGDTNEYNELLPGNLSYYIRIIRNNKLLGLVIAVIFFSQVTMSGIDKFVSEWAKIRDNTTSGLELKSEPLSADDLAAVKPYLYAYTVLILVGGYLLFQRSLIMFGMTLDISRIIHNKLCQVLFTAPLHFFSTSTRIKLKQNFSDDMKNIDLNLPMNLLDCLAFIAEVVFIIVFVLIANRLLIIPTIAVILLIYGIQRVYVKSARHIANFKSVHSNAITTHLYTSTEGGSIIRANHAKSQFIRKFYKYYDTYLAVTYLSNLLLIIFTYLTDIICCFYTILVTIGFFYITQSSINDNVVGLAITQIFILNSIFRREIKKTVNVEKYLSSLTNILQNNICEREPIDIVQDILPTNYKWPRYGQIEFKKVNLRSSDCILNELNFQIKSNEKIAILGAETVLILNTLFRFNKPACGTIKIDGFDIAKINLSNLRRNISIVPADPTVFVGTVRFNLDPANRKSDFEIVKFLREIVPDIGLNDPILNLQNTIEDLNVRQQQIISLARVLLRQNKIVIVDESIPNVNVQLSELTHRTINKFCKDCTVITLTNQLNHYVMSSDRLMILNNGRLVDYDHPYRIIDRSNNCINNLLEKYDESVRAELVNIAKENYKIL